ncbi:guanylate kinase [Mytilus galloprovincialis]|uniref:Guanylate kinase n=2 Tax=Mytilus galloprovincialis TaxID=29158 RepID=A0A8B6E4G6_MYTGA|nr:guanylate kinase [Mytilus galloprovincialis]
MVCDTGGPSYRCNGSGLKEVPSFPESCMYKKAVEDIQKTGRICILDVEVNGVKNIKKTDFNARYVFVKPPSIDVLVERLKSRGTETEESLQKRINSATESLEYAEQKGSYDHVVINDDLDKAYDEFRGLLIEDITALQQARLKTTNNDG